jgi:YVTN family beta-propeller protein
MKSSTLFCSAIAALFVLSAADPAADPLPGMPPVLDKRDIYSADAAGDLSPVVRKFPSLVYVPNSGSNSVDVIDPKTYRIIRHFRVGRQPQHVTPSYDLKTLWVLCDLGDSITLIDPGHRQEGQDSESQRSV